MQSEYRGLLLKNYQSPQDGESRASSQVQGPEATHRLQVPEVALVTTKAQVSEELVIQGFIMMLSS